MGRARLAKQRAVTRALLVRRVPYADSDLVVGLYTEQLGPVSCLARGARRSTKRFATLEPLHLLRVTLELRAGQELGALVEATVERPRIELTASLDAMQAAGQALRWLRRAAPARVAEPRLWLEVNALLDALGCASSPHAVQATLAAGSLRMLEAAGWGIELGRCVRCDRPVPDDSAVRLDMGAGGVVCRRCGRGPVTVAARQRTRLLAALGGDERALMDPEDAALALDLVERALGRQGKAG